MSAMSNQALGAAHGDLQQWRVEGGSPAFVQLGTAIRYEKEELNKFITSHTRTASAEIDLASRELGDGNQEGKQ